MGYAGNMRDDYASKTTSLNIQMPWRALEKLENMVAEKAARAQSWILWQCRRSKESLRNVPQDQADTDSLILHTRSF